jgi:hypothetical protein
MLLYVMFIIVNFIVLEYYLSIVIVIVRVIALTYCIVCY